jgi:YHS domain-containing protein
MARDPVCGMIVNEATAAFRSEYKGKTYYFCKIGCMVSFDKNPEKYAKAGAGQRGMQGMHSTTR